MLKLFLSRSTSLVLLGTFALVSVTACSNNRATNPPARTTSSVPDAAAVSAAELPAKPEQATASASPPPQQSQDSKAANAYQQALDVAVGAVSISKSAASRDDWSLVANRWQDAINLLKIVPRSSRQYKTARNKISEYQAYLADAKLKATPSPSKSCSGDTNPAFFSVPIKGRIGGTPMVEVSFNDQKFDMLFDTGASQTLITSSMAMVLNLPIAGIGGGRIADGSVMIVPLALVKSHEVDGRLRMEVPLAVAPPAMSMGLLGQDFYKGYDVTIKENVIEFRRQASTPSVSRQKATCLVDTNPKAFSVPITGRKGNIPIVEVTFNDSYTFPLLFDTGASDTVITQKMARKIGLKPAGLTTAQVADGSVVTFGLALLKSQKVASRVKTNMQVSVAPPAMEVGLLGQDFFEGYNYTIKGDVIEFSRQEP